MKIQKMVWFGALALLISRSLYAQDIVGDWQVTLKAGPAHVDLRTIFRISKVDRGLKGEMYSIDESTTPIPVNSVAFDGANVKLTIEMVRGTYQGKLSADGNAIEGTWSQGQPVPVTLKRATKETAWQIDPGTHVVHMITVDKSVKLEVLDWGGTGRPLVLLTGLGDNAHVFDKFAPKLIDRYHVFGITRRGFGVSSKPDSGYEADRLGDDVLAVIEALKLKKPVLVAHSIGGEELSAVGSRHPEKVAGLIYLDAGYPYAYYDKTRGDFDIDRNSLEKKLTQLRPGATRDPRAAVKELLEMLLPGFERDLRQMQKGLDATPEAAFAGPAPPLPPRAVLAIVAGEQKYTSIPVPVLAIYAVQRPLGPNTSPEAQVRFDKSIEDQARAFQDGVPTARVVRLAHADHYVYRSNETDVLREMNAFIGTLPP
jgi:non-heme chloroperoxidase